MSTGSSWSYARAMKTKNTHIPKTGFDYLKKLKRYNKREWYLKHKPDFENNLKTPLEQVIVELGERMSKTAPQLNFNPKRAIFRMNRDVRFSADKSPYKTNIGAFFSFLNRSKTEEAPGLYLHIEPGNCFIGGGMYMPSGEQIRKIRQMILKDPERFKKVSQNPTVKKYFGGLSGDKLKTAPKGIEKDHPQIDHLKWKQFIFIKKYKDSDFQKGSLAQKIQKEDSAMMPLLLWLEEAMKQW